jgi:metal-responsive CopG/Arc/MetJ family transcriptional regulator
MKNVVKVAISLPEELLERIDRARSRAGISRSDYFRQAAVGLLDAKTDADVKRYVQGYRENPETADEIEEARAGASSILAVDPWE